MIAIRFYLCFMLSLLLPALIEAEIADSIQHNPLSEDTIRSDSLSSETLIGTSDSGHGGVNLKSERFDSSLAPRPFSSSFKAGKKDSISDSATILAQKHLFDSLMTKRDVYLKKFQLFPENIDSIANPRVIPPYQIFQSDAIGLSELLRPSPYYTRIPVSLTSAQNRFLYFGYPIPLLSNSRSSNGLTFSAGDLLGHDYFFVNCISRAEYTPGSGLIPLMYPDKIEMPMMYIFWENNVFNENVVQTLFMRPISRQATIGIFSNFRYLRDKEFSGGGLQSTYRSVYQNDSLLAGVGHNPLTQEHVAGILGQWHKDSVFSLKINYRYVDNVNELPYAESPEFAPSIAWARVRQFAHEANLKVLGRIGDFFSVTGRGWLYSRDMKDRRFLDENQRQDSTLQGAESEYGMIVETGITLPHNHYLALRYSPFGRSKTLTDESVYTSLNNQVHALYRTGLQKNDFSLTLQVAGGPQWTRLNNSNAYLWLWDAFTKASVKKWDISFFSKRKALPFNPSVDTSLYISSKVLDPIHFWGGEGMFTGKNFSLLLAYTHADEADSVTLHSYWPRNRIPYKQPGSVLTVAPAVGKFKGFTLRAKYGYADRKPTHRAGFLLSWETSVANGKEHILLELGGDYWSRRNKISYGGITNWHWEIYDLYMKTVFQIQNFRLFMKVDNLLNRRIAYVPGSYLPPITFRWGFHWILQK